MTHATYFHCFTIVLHQTEVAQEFFEQTVGLKM